MRWRIRLAAGERRRQAVRSHKVPPAEIMREHLKRLRLKRYVMRLEVEFKD